MAETRRLAHLVESVAARLELPDGDLVVALSGGADSATLAYLCKEQKRMVRALHVNHGLPGSVLMEKAAATIAETLGIDVEVVAVQVPEGASPEGQARRARYGAFSDATVPGERLLTGHTRDDDVETILLNVIRGTGPRGLTGIPYFRPHNIARPMLGVSRSETREVAGLAGLGFVDDPMNDDPKLMRNVVRRQIIPVLAQLNPRLGEALTRLASSLASDVEYLSQLAGAAVVTIHEDAVSIPIGILVSSPRAVADRILIGMLEQTLGVQSVTSDRLDRVWSVVKGETSHQEIARGAAARRDGPNLMISGDSATDTPRGPIALSPGMHDAGRIEFEVAAMHGPCRVLPLSKWAAVFPSDTALVADQDGVVSANGDPAWVPGVRRLPVAWYEPGTIGYLSVFAREKTGWTSGL